METINFEEFKKYNFYVRRLPVNYHVKTFDTFKATGQLIDVKNKLMNNWNGEPVSLLSNLTGVGKTHLACSCLFKYEQLKINQWIEKNKDNNFEQYISHRNKLR